MALSLIILISVVFIIVFAWFFIKGADDGEFCDVCGIGLITDEVDKCNMCNAYERGEVL